MAVVKCKMCGASLEYEEGLGYARCEYCGTVNMINEVFESEAEQTVEIDKTEIEYQHCKERIRHAKTNADFRNVAFALEDIAWYKDSLALSHQCRQKAKELLKQERRKKHIKWAIIISIIALIILIPIVINCASKNNHDKTKISINATSMRSEYREYDPPYINGRWYVYITFKVENKSGVDVDYLSVTTYISDKNGISLGTIRSEFGNNSSLNLKAGKYQIHENYICTNRLESEPLLYALYNGKFSDFIFDYKIESIEFSDGQYYFGE